MALRRMLAVLVAVGLVVLVVVLTASGSSTGVTAAKKKSVTLHLVEKEVGFNFVDNPPRQGFDSPPLAGDQFALTSDLQTKSGSHVGTLEALCTFTRGGERARGSCYGVLAFKGGQVAVMALLSDAADTHIAVVGGTGAYEGVSGSAVSIDRGDENPLSDLTVHLIWP